MCKQARLDTSYQVHQRTYQYGATPRSARYEEGYYFSLSRAEGVRIYRQQGMLGGREKLPLACIALNETMC